MSALSSDSQAIATFAGGCFWCMQPPFDNLRGVLRTEVGFTGGTLPKPSYEQVCSGSTGHFEAIRVFFDPLTVSYEVLLQTFWQNIDPTQADGQFHDRGMHYRTAIFYHDETQKTLAESTKAELENSKKFESPIQTLILPATEFFPAEDYHQGYYQKNSEHYGAYKEGSGRGPFIRKTWGK